MRINKNSQNIQKFIPIQIYPDSMRINKNSQNIQKFIPIQLMSFFCRNGWLERHFVVKIHLLLIDTLIQAINDNARSVDQAYGLRQATLHTLFRVKIFLQNLQKNSFSIFSNFYIYTFSYIESKALTLRYCYRPVQRMRTKSLCRDLARNFPAKMLHFLLFVKPIANCNSNRKTVPTMYNYLYLQ